MAPIASFIEQNRLSVSWSCAGQITHARESSVIKCCCRKFCQSQNKSNLILCHAPTCVRKLVGRLLATTCLSQDSRDEQAQPRRNTSPESMETKNFWCAATLLSLDPLVVRLLSRLGDKNNNKLVILLLFCSNSADYNQLVIIKREYHFCRASCHT